MVSQPLSPSLSLSRASTSSLYLSDFSPASRHPLLNRFDQLLNRFTRYTVEREIWETSSATCFEAISQRLRVDLSTNLSTTSRSLILHLSSFKVLNAVISLLEVGFWCTTSNHLMELQVMEGKEELIDRLQQWLRQVDQWIHEVPDEQLFVAIAVLLLTSVLFLLVRLLNRAKSNTIVLAGLSGSGKTVLFYQLRDGSSHQGTVTSMDPNEDTFIFHSESSKTGKRKPVHVIDVPGHYRLRAKLDDYLPQAAAVVFVVDALDFLPNCRAAAEYLYDILTKASVVKKKIPVLLLCNKTDKVTAHTKEFVKKQLEKEIDKLRTSRTAVSEADLVNEFTLGVVGEVFSFSQCRNKVSVAEGSGLTGQTVEVEQFIREYVRP